jgi:hypothetical protein
MDNKKRGILKELEKQHGIVSAACHNVGLPRSTFYLWCNSDQEFKKAVDDIQEVAIDYVESKLFEKIQGVTIKGKGARDEDDEPPVYELPPSDTAIIFYLKTKGKKRGYIEKTGNGAQRRNGYHLEGRKNVQRRRKVVIHN